MNSILELTNFAGACETIDKLNVKLLWKESLNWHAWKFILMKMGKESQPKINNNTLKANIVAVLEVHDINEFRKRTAKSK